MVGSDPNWPADRHHNAFSILGGNVRHPASRPARAPLGAGSVVTLTVNLSEAVTVAGGTPTLTLHDGGNPTYTGGSCSNAPSAKRSGQGRTPPISPVL